MMATYELTSPDGHVFQVTAPDDATQDQVMAYFQNSYRAGDVPDVEKAAPSTKKLMNSPQGNDAGDGNAFTYGMLNAVPGLNTAASALGALGAKIGGAEGSFGNLYDQAQADTKATQEASPLASLAGNVSGIAAMLPIGIEKAIFGKIPDIGLRGAVNAIPRATSALADFARSSEFAGSGALSNLGNLALRAVKGGLVAAPAGALYGAGNAEDGKRLEGAASGAELAAGIGAGLPIAGAGASAVGGAILPKIEGATAALAQRAQELGIPLRLDQISPTRVRNTIQKVSQEIPFSGVDAAEEAQRQAWNKAVSRTIGQDSDNLGPQTIKNFLSDASKKFSSAIGDQDIVFTQKELNKIGDIVENAKSEITGDLVDVVKANVDKFMKDVEVSPGGDSLINSKKLASLRSQIIKKLPSIDGGARQQVGKIVDVIDDVAGRQISPERANIISQARREWRNYRTIDPLLEKSPDGNINPTDLMHRVASNKYIDTSKTDVGEDDLVDLARIGKKFLTKKGGSDTAQKAALLGTGGGIVAGILNPVLGAKMVAGVGANSALQSLNRNQTLVRKAISNAKNPGLVKKISKQISPNLISSSAVQIKKE